MKKIFSLILMITLVVSFFSACGEANEKFPDDPELTSLTGILAEQNNSDDEGGSHFLIDENGEKIPVRSLSINLSSVRYLNNRIEVLGFKNKKDEVFEITGVSVVELLSNEREEIAELVKYENTELGFEIKYYSSWTASENDDGVTFFAPQESEADTDLDKVIITQSNFDYAPSDTEEENSVSALSAYVKANYPKIEDISPLMSKVGVDKLDSVKFEEADGVITYLMYRFGLIYKIEFIASKTKPVAKNKAVFSEMLQSFRFVVFDDLGHEENAGDDEEVNSDATAASDESLPSLDMNLTVFESLPYHFSGKYPASWYYAGVTGKEDGVLHHYSFSDESVTDENEIVSLDVLSNGIPAGQKLTMGDKQFTVIQSGNKYTVYTTVDSRNYKVSGNKEYKDLILVMAGNIVAVPENE